MDGKRELREFVQSTCLDVVVDDNDDVFVFYSMNHYDPHLQGNASAILANVLDCNIMSSKSSGTITSTFGQIPWAKL